MVLHVDEALCQAALVAHSKEQEHRRNVQYAQRLTKPGSVQVVTKEDQKRHTEGKKKACFLVRSAGQDEEWRKDAAEKECKAPHGMRLILLAARTHNDGTVRATLSLECFHHWQFDKAHCRQ